MTKKVGSTGKYGARYGWGVKVAAEKIERKQRMSYVCPSCKRRTLKRLSVGIWVCRKCKAKFAGAAYSPTTELTVTE